MKEVEVSLYVLTARPRTTKNAESSQADPLARWYKKFKNRLEPSMNIELRYHDHACH